MSKTAAVWFLLVDGGIALLTGATVESAALWITGAILLIMAYVLHYKIRGE